MFTVVGDGEAQQHDERDVDGRAVAGSGSLIDSLAREGARRMLAAALQAEVEAYVSAFADAVDEAGHRLVVRKKLRG